VTEFTSDNRHFRQIRDFYETQQLTAISLDGRHSSGQLTYSWRAGWSRGNFDGDPDRDVAATFRSGFSDNQYSLVPGSYTPQFDTSANRDNPNRFNLFSLDLGTRFTQDDEYVLRTDVQRDMDILGGPGFLKFGAQARFRQRDLVNIDRFYDSANAVGFNAIGWNLGLPNFRGMGSPIRRYGSTGFVRGAYDFGFYIDPAVTRDIVNDLNRSGDLTFTADGLVDSQVRSLMGSYEASEDVYALYGMAQTTLDKWTLMAGLRGEFTRLNFDGFNGIGAGSLFTNAVPISKSESYIDLMPGLHIRYDASEEMIVRAAVTRTIARPSYTQLNPAGRVNNLDFAASLGSGKLKPVRSTNVDLFVDYYLGRLGIISGGVFFKQMDNNVYRFNFTDVGINIPGASDPAAIYDVTEFRNAKGATVYGFELGFERDLSFLPAPLDGFGVFANFTHIESDVDTGLPGRTGKTPLFGQVEQSINGGITYQKRGFQARIAYTWRDDYLDFNGLNEDQNLDRYRTSIGILDVTASYGFRNGVTVFTEFRNLTDSADRGYAGNSALRPNFNENRDWSATMGVRARF
jgi:TonB-dependent receptor